MSKFNKETEKSVRIVLPLKLYEQLKERCLDYGDISRVVRHLLRKWLNEGGSIRASYEAQADILTPIEMVEILTAKLKSVEILLKSRESGKAEDDEPTGQVRP